MKKIGKFALILAMLCALAGCGSGARGSGSGQGGEGTEKTDADVGSGGDEILTSPPALVVWAGECSEEAFRGSYSWRYDNGDGTQSGGEADSIHPLDGACEKYMPVLPAGAQETVNLRFDTLPDEVSAWCWDASFRGDLSAADQRNPVSVRKNGDGYEMTLCNGGIGAWIYEVSAQWESAKGYGGTAYYAFSTESPIEPRETGAVKSIADSGEISLYGSNGAFTITVPQDWNCVGLLQNGEGDSYSIRMRPEGEQEGYISISYEPWFGVCGTGLEEQETELAGDRAVVGYYDGKDNWSFVIYQGKNEKIVALNQAPDWSEAYREQIMQVLDSLKYEPEKTPEDMSLYYGWNHAYDVFLMVQDITATGADLYLSRHSGDAERSISYGEDYRIQVYNEEKQAWELFHDINPVYHMVAYKIPCDENVDIHLNWKEIYGELGPGLYMLSKTLDDENCDPHSDGLESMDVNVKFVIY